MPYDRRQPSELNLYWAAGSVLGIILIAIGMIMNAVDAAQLRDLTNRISGLEPRRAGLFSQQPIAESEVNQNAPNFARHWSEGFPEALEASRKNLEEHGAVAMLTQSAQTALDSDDRTTADAQWSLADQKLKASEQILTTILGPPKYYASLKQKSDAVDSGYLDDVQRDIDAKRSSINAMPRKILYGTQVTLSYQPAYSLLDQALSDLNTTARVTLITPTTDGFIDKPVAYDQAQAALQTAARAVSTVNELSQGADTAAGEIQSCESSLSRANGELSGAYDSTSAKNYYDQADTAYGDALSAMARQDFTSVASYSSDCTTYADDSYDAAQPPPPTPVPQQQSSPSTSTYSNNNDDSGPSVSCCDSTTTTDYSNDEPSYGGNDGFGGSDSYTPDDGFGGNDGFTEDDGF